MTVSVIVPAFNAASTLADALGSLVTQSFSDWEAIVVDDGSTDDTVAIVRRFAGEDDRFKLITGEHAGISQARNRGIDAARGRLLLFLDSDDWVSGGHLESMTAALQECEGCDAAHCGWTRVSFDGRIHHVRLGPDEEDLFPLLAERRLFPINACLVRAEPVRALGGFDTSLQTCEDWDLWQRLSRSGIGFTRVDATLAFCRLRPDAPGLDPQRTIIDGLRVIERGHAYDEGTSGAARVRAGGQDAYARASFEFAAWVGGLCLGGGAEMRPLWGRVRHLGAPDLAPSSIAYAIFDSAVLPRGMDRREWEWLWREDFDEPLRALLEALESLSGTPHLASRAQVSLERLIADHSKRQLVTLTNVHSAEIETSEPVEDIRVPATVSRVRLRVRYLGQPLGSIELPALDGWARSYVIRDAIAAEFAWNILRIFFGISIYRELSSVRESDGTAVYRGDVRVARGLDADFADDWTQSHDRLGWTIFLQELWGRRDWEDGRFYDESEMYPAPTITVGDGQASIEVSADTPSLKSPLPEVAVRVLVGGIPIGTIHIEARAGRVSAGRLLSTINAAGGMELCRCVVREALVGQPEDGSPLRDRLQRAARRASQRNLGETKFVPEGHVPLGRRAVGIEGTSFSRRAIFPAALTRTVTEAARALGEPVGKAEREVIGAAYAPEYVGSGVVRDREIVSADDGLAGAFARPYDRAYFEMLFASAQDPWRYMSAYEQVKYEQTLSLLPPGHVASALEIGCAEGHFTEQLASRVDQLVAADVSEIALQRAAKKCRDHSNVTFQHLDLTTDPLPGPFDVIVCSEILYFVGQRRDLRRVAGKLRRALRPGGYLLMAHSNVLADDPSKTGFDWDVPFGAEWIEASFGKTPFLSLVKAIRTPLYRIHLFRRSRVPITTRAETEVIQLDKQPTALPARVAAHVAWHGTDQQRGVGVERVATERLPILMYHRVAPEGRESARRYRVTPDQFEEQLEFLQSCGYHGIDLDAWRTAVETKRGLTGRAVLITFDDATEDFAESAWPLLQRYGFPTTLFVPTAHVGRHNAWDEGHGDRIPLLSWDELADLARAGLHVGAHSCTHPYMTTLSNEEVVREAVQARVSLWEGIGKKVDAFAYPYGDSDASVRHLVGASGYRYGLAAGSAPATFGHSLLALPRIEVNGQEPFDRFVSYLGR